MRRRNSSIHVSPKNEQNTLNPEPQLRSLKTLKDESSYPDSTQANNDSNKSLLDLLQLVQARLKSSFQENKSLNALLKHTQLKLQKIEEENNNFSTIINDYDSKNKEFQQNKASTEEQYEEQIRQLKQDMENQKANEELKEARYLSQIHKKSQELDNVLIKMNNLNQKFLAAKQELADTQNLIAEKLQLLEQERNLREQTKEALVKNDEHITYLKNSLTNVFEKLKHQQEESDKMQKDMLEKIKVEHDQEVADLSKIQSEQISFITKSYEEKIERLNDRFNKKEKSLKEYFDTRFEDQRKRFQEKVTDKEKELSKLEGLFHMQKSALQEQNSLLLRQVDRLQDEIVWLKKCLESKEKDAVTAKFDIQKYKNQCDNIKNDNMQIQAKSRAEIKVLKETVGQLHKDKEGSYNHELNKIASSKKAVVSYMKEAYQKEINEIKNQFCDEVDKINHMHEYEKKLLIDLIATKDCEILKLKIENEEKIKELLRNLEEEKEKQMRENEEILEEKIENIKKRKKDIEEVVNREKNEIINKAANDKQAALNQLRDSYLREIERMKEEHELQIKEYRRIQFKYDELIKKYKGKNKRELLPIQKDSEKSPEKKNYWKKQLKIEIEIRKTLEKRIDELNNHINELKKPIYGTEDKNRENSLIELEASIDKNTLINSQREIIQELEIKLSTTTNQLQSQYNRLSAKHNELLMQLKDYDKAQEQIHILYNDLEKRDRRIAKLESDLDNCKKQIKDNELDVQFLFNTPQLKSSPHIKHLLKRSQTPKSISSYRVIKRNSPDNRINRSFMGI